MNLQQPQSVLQRELEALQAELAALMETWAATDWTEARKLAQLECRRQLLLARISMRQRAIASYPHPVEKPVETYAQAS